MASSPQLATKREDRAQPRLGQRLKISGLTALLSVALWELVWFLSGGIGFHHSWTIAGFLAGELISGSFWSDLLVTVALALGGLFMGLVVAVVVGWLASSTPFIEKSSRGVLYFGRAIPSVALIPLLMAAVGSRTAIVTVLVVWLVAIKLVLFVIRGFRDIESTRTELVKILGLSKFQHLVFVQLPAASAHIVTGVRLSVNRAYGAVVLAGLLAGTPGIGRTIQLARTNGDSEAVLGYAVIAGLLGVVFFWVFGRVEDYFVKWRPVA